MTEEVAKRLKEKYGTLGAPNQTDAVPTSIMEESTCDNESQPR